MAQTVHILCVTHDAVAVLHAADAGSRLAMMPSAGGGGGSCDSYEDVIRRAESLFNKIRFSVTQQTAPTTLKARRILAPGS